MCEPISFQEIKLENGWLMIKPLREDMWKVFAFLNKMRDRIYQLELREYRQKRSLDANAYAWTLIGKLAAETRIPKEEVYREAIRNIGGNCEVIPIRSKAVKKFMEAWSKNGIGWQCEDMGDSKFPGYRNLYVYYGSSVYDPADVHTHRQADTGLQGDRHRDHAGRKTADAAGAVGRKGGLAWRSLSDAAGFAVETAQQIRWTGITSSPGRTGRSRKNTDSLCTFATTAATKTADTPRTGIKTQGLRCHVTDRGLPWSKTDGRWMTSSGSSGEITFNEERSVNVQQNTEGIHLRFRLN